MTKYKIIKNIMLNEGEIVLNDKQANARRHCLQNIKNDNYKIIKPVSFKVGEIFEYSEALMTFEAEELNNTKQAITKNIKPILSKVDEISEDSETSMKSEAEEINNTKQAVTENISAVKKGGNS